ncbi:MAG: hypothetical protein H5T69_17995 [Chloroflexi bacterium]|nr:hypothetical protein [Chloroflexota bacterium]
MHVILVTLIVISLALFAVTPIAQIHFSNQEMTRAGWREMVERERTRADTHLEVVSAQAQNLAMTAVLRNVGTTKLADWSQWDVIVQYYGLTGNLVICWLPSEAGNGRWWAVEGLYYDAEQGQGEVFDLGTLNPGEEVKMRITLSQPVAAGSLVSLTVVTPEGVRASTTLMAD